MLAAYYGTIWRRRGDPAVLDLAVELATEAVEIMEARDWARASALNTLSWWLGQKFELVGAMDDLEKAIQVAEEAVDLAVDIGSYFRNSSLMFNMGNLLMKRWHRFKEDKDIDRAIALAERGVKLIPSESPDRAARLANQCDWLYLRADHHQSEEDDARATEIAIEATLTTAHDAPERAYLHSVVTRQATSGSTPQGIPLAILLGEEAAKETPDGHPERAIRLQNLGIFHELQYRLDRHVNDLNGALSYYSQSWSCRNGNPLVRLQSAMKKATMQADIGRWKDASDVLSEAVSMISKISPRTLSNADKQHIRSCRD